MRRSSWVTIEDCFLRIIVEVNWKVSVSLVRTTPFLIFFFSFLVSWALALCCFSRNLCTIYKFLSLMSLWFGFLFMLLVMDGSIRIRIPIPIKAPFGLLKLI